MANEHLSAGAQSLREFFGLDLRDGEYESAFAAALLALANSVRKKGLPPALITDCQQAPTIAYAIAMVLDAIAEEGMTGPRIGVGRDYEDEKEAIESCSCPKCGVSTEVGFNVCCNAHEDCPGGPFPFSSRTD